MSEYEPFYTDDEWDYATGYLSGKTIEWDDQLSDSISFVFANLKVDERAQDGFREDLELWFENEFGQLRTE